MSFLGNAFEYLYENLKLFIGFDISEIVSK